MKKIENFNFFLLMNILKIILLVFFVQILNGCVSHIPIIKSPENRAKIPEHWTSKPNSPSFTITNSLLDLLNNSELKLYINESIKNNFDIKSAIARLKASNYLLRGSKGKFLPSIDAEFSSINHNQEIDLNTGNRKKSKNYRTAVNISWEADIWGKISDNYSAEKHRYIAESTEFISFRDSLAARVVQAWIRAVSSALSKKALEKQVKYYRLLEKQFSRKYKKGLISILEIYNIRQKVRDIESRLIEIEEDHARNIRELEILAGRPPENKLVSGTVLPDVGLAAYKIPAEIIKNRPDIQKELAQLKSAELLSRAAKKRLLPSLSLTGSISKEGKSLKLLKGADILWNLIGSLTQPLFSGGRLIAEYKAQSSEAQSILWKLESTILRALKEVEDALGRENSLSTRIKQMEKVLLSAQSKNKYIEKRYKHGLADFYTLLLNKIEENEIETNLIQLRTWHLTNRVDLALSMGIGINKSNKKEDINELKK